MACLYYCIALCTLLDLTLLRILNIGRDTEKVLSTLAIVRCQALLTVRLLEVILSKLIRGVVVVT